MINFTKKIFFFRENHFRPHSGALMETPGAQLTQGNLANFSKACRVRNKSNILTFDNESVEI